MVLVYLSGPGFCNLGQEDTTYSAVLEKPSGAEGLGTGLRTIAGWPGPLLSKLVVIVSVWDLAVCQPGPWSLVLKMSPGIAK